MDMRETFRYTVTDADVDSRGYMTPRALIQQLVLAATFRNKEEGGGMGVLRAKLGAAWMFRRVKLEQLKSIKEGDVLVGYGSGRTNCVTEYILRGVFMRADEEVARLDIAMMPVMLKARKKLTCKDIEPFYTTQPLNEVPAFERLPMAENLEYATEKTITKDDCDKNAAHFASHNYADLVCRETGYWEGDYRMIAKMQIDYVKECVTGDTIRMGKLADGGKYIVQGIHTNGKPCFNALCEYEQL